MTVAQWSDRLKTGNREIDKEHWGLFALINELADKRAHGDDPKSIAATFEALAAYVGVHFEHEERLLEEIGYPELKVHKKAHAGLVRRVETFRAAFERAPEAFDYEALMEFLSNWLREHILIIDMEYVEYMRKHDLTAS